MVRSWLDNRRWNRGRVEGFTLVEAVVALTLFALLSVFLFGALRFGSRAAAIGSDIIDRSSEISIAESFLRNQMSAAQPLIMPGTDRQAVIAFDGEPDRLDFVALPPAYLAVGGFHWLRVSMDGNGNRRRLVIRWEPVRPADNATDSLSTGGGVLVERIKAVTFAYFGSLEDGHPSAWHDHWRDAGALPELVRLRIILADGRMAPDLLVAPRLTGTAATVR